MGKTNLTMTWLLCLFGWFPTTIFFLTLWIKSVGFLKYSKLFDNLVWFMTVYPIWHFHDYKLSLNKCARVGLVFNIQLNFYCFGSKIVNWSIVWDCELTLANLIWMIKELFIKINNLKFLFIVFMFLLILSNKTQGDTKTGKTHSALL